MLTLAVYYFLFYFTGYVPSGAREEQLKDRKIAEGIHCEELQVDGRLHGILVRRCSPTAPHSTLSKERRTVLFYMQGWCICIHNSCQC